MGSISEQIEASTVTKQFKRTFCEARLNELGKAVRFCLRERTVTPFRLVMGLINVMSTPKVETIADVQRPVRDRRAIQTVS